MEENLVKLHQRQILVDDLIAKHQVALGMTLAEVQALLGEGDLAQVGVPPELGTDMVLYAGAQIVVGFTAGRLEYVETLALQGTEEANEP